MMPNWTEAELNVIRDNEGKMTVRELQELIPNRSDDVIRTKLQKLNIKYIQKQNRWNKDEVEVLVNNCGLGIDELDLMLPFKNKMEIFHKGYSLKVKIKNTYHLFWTEEEDQILINNSNGVSTFEKVHTLLPHRTLSAVKGRISALGISISDPDKIPVIYTENYSKNHSLFSRYKNKFGIILNRDLNIDTFDPIQWWKWYFYGTPNNGKIASLPNEIYSDTDKLIKIIKYVIENEIGFNNRKELLNIDIKTLNAYKINFIYKFPEKSFLNLINLVYPNYNIKAYELKNAPLGFWFEKSNCDKYLRYVVDNEMMTDEILNVKTQIPPMFTFDSLRALGYSSLVYSMSRHIHYDSFFDWLNFLYPEWGLQPEDFDEKIAFDGTKLNSHEELTFYTLVKKELGVNIVATCFSKEKIFYDKEHNCSYFPDFLIKTNEGNDIIVEYFGLYRENYGESEILKTYHFKTKDKIRYFSKLKDYRFLPIFHDELKDVKSLSEKILAFCS